MLVMDKWSSFPSPYYTRGSRRVVRATLIPPEGAVGLLVIL